MELGSFHRLSHDVAICITTNLIGSIIEQLLHLLIRSARFAVFQLDDIRILHVLINITERRQEDVSISTLIVQLRDRTIETILGCHRQSKAMYESLPFLLVSLRGIALQAISNESKILLIVAIIRQLIFQSVLVIIIISQVILLISVKKIYPR